MATDVDTVLDRRSLRRKVTFWRAAAFVVLAAMLVGFAILSDAGSLFSKRNSPHIARVKIEGVITNDGPMLKLLEKVGENENVAAVVLDLSSPGGSTVGGEAMYEAVRNLSGQKPVVTSIGTLAASAGYMIASASDRVVARRSSIVGSIGVLFQYADVTGLLDKVGVKMEAIKSRPLKAEPSPFNPTTPEERAMIDRLVQDSYNWFVDLVTERRNLPRARVLELADGSIFTGAQALENGLVDEIGGEDKAVAWLEKEKGIAEDLEVFDYKPARPRDGLFGDAQALSHIARLFGIELDRESAKGLGQMLRERLLLDGLVSIWQVSNKQGGAY